MPVLIMVAFIAMLLHWGAGFVVPGDWTLLVHGVITLSAVSLVYATCPVNSCTACPP